MNRKIVLKSVLAVAMLGFVLVSASCKKDVNTPADLSVTNVTETTAKLTWTGTADSYEILLTSQSAAEMSFSISTTTNSCLVTNLTENTLYTWKIRAKRGKNYSEWVSGTSFTTAKGTPDAHQIVGTWNYETVSLKEIVCDNPVTRAMILLGFQDYVATNIEMILGGTYEFTADGKATRKINEETEKGLYVVDGDKLTITYAEDNVSATFNLSFADKTMYWEFDIFDMTEILTKHGYEPYLTELSSNGVTKAVLKITLKKQ